MRHSTIAPAPEHAPRPRARVLAAIITTTLLAGGLSAGIAGPASAADGTTISNGAGSGGWSVQPRWVQYVTMFAGSTTPALPSTCAPGSLGSPLPADCAIPLTVSGGAYDATTGDTNAHLSSIGFDVPAHGVSLLFSDIALAIDGDTHTGTITADISGNPATVPAGTVNDYVLATLDTTAATITPGTNTVAFSGVTGTISADVGDYITSWSAYESTAIAPLAFSMSAPLATTTAISASPAATPLPVALGTATTVTATVDATSSTEVPTGTVDFYDVRGATSTQTLLAADVPLNASGVASYTGTLVAGGHRFLATYKPAATGTVFAGSTLTTTANYGVYDLSVPVVTPPAAGAASSTGLTATWAFSNYSNLNTGAPIWSKTAVEGNVTVTSARDFAFTGGVATYSDGVFQVAFDATIRIEPNAGFWVTLTDPTLIIGADGRGTWTAGMVTNDAPTAAPVATTVLTVTGASIPNLSGSPTSKSIAFDYTDSIAYGTWNAAYGSGWANQFMLRLPSSIRSYFYQTSTSTGNLAKPAQPLVLDWSSAVVVPTPKTSTAVTLASSATSVVSGTAATLTATVTGATDGTVEFADESGPFGTATITGGTATLATPTTFAVGTHTITASYAGSATTKPSASGPLVLEVTAPVVSEPVVSAPVVTAPVVTTPAVTPAPVVAVEPKATAKVTLKAATFAKNTKPTVSVTLPKLANGKYASGNVRVYVNGKSVTVVKLTTSKKGKVTVTLPKKYSRSIKVSIKYGGSSTVKAVTSKTVKLTVKK